MLRIEAEANGSHRTVRATGRLSGPWVAELQRSVQPGDDDTTVLLDLTDVSFVDRDGIELLRTLQHDGRILLRCSAFVTAQLM